MDSAELEQELEDLMSSLSLQGVTVEKSKKYILSQAIKFKINFILIGEKKI